MVDAVLPKGWRMATVDDVKGTRSDSLATGPFGSSIASRFFTASGVPVIRGSNLSEMVGRRLIDDDFVFVSEEKAAEFKRAVVRKGDLVFTCWGTVGQVGLIDDRAKYPAYVISNKQMKLTPNPDVADSLFLYYALSCPLVADQYQANKIGSSVPGFNLGQLKGISFPLPPLPTQRAIAGVLGALDDKIEVNRRMARTLEAAARALFESWFVRFEHPATKAPAPRLVDSPMGPIPEGWSAGTIGDLVEAVGGGTPSTKEPAYWTDGEYPFCTPKDMSGISEAVILSTERKVTDAGLAQISSGLLPPGTVVMSSRAPIGYLGIAEVPLTINQGIIAMKCTKGVPPVWVLRWCEVNMDRIKSAANGSTFMEISKQHFRPLAALVPPAALVAEYAKVAEPMYRRVVNSVQENRALSAMRDALLPKLISGGTGRAPTQWEPPMTRAAIIPGDTHGQR